MLLSGWLEVRQSIHMAKAMNNAANGLLQDQAHCNQVNQAAAEYAFQQSLNEYHKDQ